MKMKRKAKNGWTIALAVLLIVGALGGLLFQGLRGSDAHPAGNAG